VSIVKCLLFLAGQNMALRGHDDDGLPYDVNLHQGNFKNVIAFRAEAGDDVLVQHLQTCPKNASYLSPRIQNELILLSAHVVREKLIRELTEKRLFYLLLADETSDISGREQLSISVRYVSSKPDADGELIHEVFLGFIALENLTAVAVASKICEFLNSIGLSVSLIRGNILSQKTHRIVMLSWQAKFAVLKMCEKSNDVVVFHDFPLCFFLRTRIRWCACHVRSVRRCTKTDC
jgi:hypothetical protein